jgi:hypothetical protein
VGKALDIDSIGYPAAGVAGVFAAIKESDNAPKEAEPRLD